MDLEIDRNNVSIGVIVMAEYFKQLKPKSPLKVSWGEEISLDLNDDLRPTLRSAPIIIREFSRLANLCGPSAIERNEVDDWILFTCSFQVTDDSKMEMLEKSLSTKTFLVGQSLTTADLAVWGIIFGKTVPDKFVSVKRWFKLIESQPTVESAIDSLPEDVKIAKRSPSPQEETGIDYILSQLEVIGGNLMDLKSGNPDEAQVDSVWKELLELKANYQSWGGRDFSIFEPKESVIEDLYSIVYGMISTATSPFRGTVGQPDEQGDRLRLLALYDRRIKACVDEIEKLKTEKAESVMITTFVKKILNLKEMYKSFGCEDWQGLEARMETNFSAWYYEVLTKSELVKCNAHSIDLQRSGYIGGCYILLSWAHDIWKLIQDFITRELLELGVKACKHPFGPSIPALREKTRIEDFGQPYVNWILDKLEIEEILPNFNWWNSVNQWENENLLPLIGKREFLWQEGYSAFATAQEAKEQVFQILELYSRFYTDFLAIPVVKGRKTEKEKFTGGDFTATIEAFIAASGRGIQGAASHHLGQKFVEHSETKEKHDFFHNFWGLTSSAIGIMTMVHSDDKGLVIPPNVAPVQVIIVPHSVEEGDSDKTRKTMKAACREYEDTLNSAGIRAKVDDRDGSSAEWKLKYWEMKGVPIRLEIFLLYEKKKQYVAFRRDTGEEKMMSSKSITKDLTDLLDDIQHSLLTKATKELEDHMVVVENFDDFIPQLEKKNIILSPFCGEESCEENIERDSRDDGVEPGAKSICIPLEQPSGEVNDAAKCIHPNCTSRPKYYCLFGRSY